MASCTVVVLGVATASHPDDSLESRWKRTKSWDDAHSRRSCDDAAAVIVAALAPAQQPKVSWSSTEYDDANRRAAMKLQASGSSSHKVHWDQVIASAVDSANGNIDLSSRGLTELPASIADLRHLILLSTPPTAFPIARLNARSFNRVASAPLRFAPSTADRPSPIDACSSSNHPVTTPSRALQRTLSSGSLSSSTASTSSSSSTNDSIVPLSLFFANNFLNAASLPSAFFSLVNLTVLSLRGNCLEALSPAIGRLTRLVELNLGNNSLSSLPAEILLLPNLRSLFLAGNNFLSPPKVASVRLDASSTASSDTTQLHQHRLLGPLVTHFKLPSLVEITNRLLLAYAPSSDDHHSHRSHQHLSTRATGSGRNRTRRIALEPNLRTTLPEHLFAPFAGTLAPSSMRAPKKVGADKEVEFDPLANVCRSRAHEGVEITFVRAAIERIEWVAEEELKKGAASFAAGAVVLGKKSIPVLHRGCAVGCLDWLDEEQR